jgi:hypothetical protein
MGNQNYGERLGLHFNTTGPIRVTELRAFDSGQNGFQLPIMVAILDSTTSQVVAGPVTFQGNTDPLSGFYRSRPITPVVLPIGKYVVVAIGYGTSEPNGNSNIGSHPVTTTNPGGAIIFTHSGFGGIGIGVPNFYFATPGAFHAGSFRFNPDVTSPTLDCPEDIDINLDAEECEAEVLYMEPEEDDNCDVGTPILLEGPVSGSILEVGNYTVVYQVSDAAGNTGTCSFQIMINDKIASNLACQPVQLSLDEDCEAVLTPYMALTGYLDEDGNVTFGCPENFIINVKTKNNLNLGNTVGISQVGQTLDYSIENVYGFSCWNTLTIKDKIKPSISCNDASVPCLTPLENVGVPDFDDNCGAVLKKIEEIIDNTINCDLNIVRTVTRRWAAIDPSGSSSDTCVSIITLERPRIMGITPPINVTFECSDDIDLDNAGNPHPSEAGVPMFGTVALYPSSALQMQFCNATIDYKDQISIQTDCKKIILRRWRILEWWCGTLVEHFIFDQRISILDTEGPTFEVASPLTFSTLTQSCSGRVELPQLEVQDNCHAVPKVWVTVLNAAGQPVINLNTNGGTFNLPTGQYTAIYTGEDACRNQSNTRIPLVVVDNTDPQAVCAQFNTVSLNSTGYSDITAASIGGSSSDECGPVSLLIRRMEDPCGGDFDTDWFDRVEFCCLDVGTRPMIQVLVTDAGGNTNICMVSVQVQDLQEASIRCPMDTIIKNCNFLFDSQNSNTTFGAAQVLDNCPSNYTINQSFVDNRTNCGVGDILRTFTLNPRPAAQGSCTQKITFQNTNPFYINSMNPQDPTDDIIWPKDYYTTSTCLRSGLEPNMLPDSSARPLVVEGKCDLVAMRKEDDVSQPASNGACFKILRVWSVIDWCQKDDTGEPIIWTYEQQIIVIDRVAPVFTPNTQSKEIRIADCEPARISFTALATDCTPANELVYSFSISQGASILKSGIGRNATDTLPVGSYHVRFTCSDRCGNISSQEFDFVIISTKAPALVCSNKSINLVQTSNGVERTLNVSDIIVKADHPCGYEVTASFLPNSISQTRTFNCTHRNTVVSVPIYVTASNGQTATCVSMISIQDIDKLCTNLLTSNIAGKIATRGNKSPQKVDIDLFGAEFKSVEANEEGHYFFADNTNGSNYQIVPKSNHHILEGVSTLDLVNVQRHILGLQKITDPYLLIAGDIDHNDKINAADLVSLRKTILGVNSEFENNTSWRFVDKSQIFKNPNDPWAEGLAESYNIAVLENDMNIDFVAIKVGDVNGTINDGFIENEIGSRSLVQLLAGNRHVHEGDIVNVPIYIHSVAEMIGLQLKLGSQFVEVLELNSDVFDVGSDYFYTHDNNTSVVLYSTYPLQWSPDKPVFTLKVKAKKSGYLKEMLNLINSNYSHLYANINTSQNISIEWLELDSTFKLLNAAPNPWSVSTSIGFIVPEEGQAIFNVYDISGKNYVTKSMNVVAGENTFVVNRSEINKSGVYIYEVLYKGQKVTGKMILME